MGKIGRNHPCPCGSGKKYKHCCLSAQQAGTAVNPVKEVKVSLLAEIAKIQQAAVERRETFRELGVFLFFSTSQGDAWVLEVTDSDAVKVAEAGSAMDVPIDENPETIEVNWSHTFAIRERQFFLTAYADKTEARLENAPTQQIRAAIRRVRKRFSPEMLGQVHVSAADESET